MTTAVTLPADCCAKYIPPHPQRGTPYHRYLLFFLAHPEPKTEIAVPLLTAKERSEFQLKEFCKSYGFDATRGGAVYVWREKWDESVSSICKDIFSKMINLLDTRFDFFA